MQTGFGGRCNFHGVWEGAINCPDCMAGVVATGRDEIARLKRLIQEERARTLWWKVAASYCFVGVAIIASLALVILLIVK